MAAAGVCYQHAARAVCGDIRQDEDRRTVHAVLYTAVKEHERDIAVNAALSDEADARVSRNSPGPGGAAMQRVHWHDTPGFSVQRLIGEHKISSLLWWSGPRSTHHPHATAHHPNTRLSQAGQSAARMRPQRRTGSEGRIGSALGVLTVLLVGDE